MRILNASLLVVVLASGLTLAGCATTDREPRRPEADESPKPEAQATTVAPTPPTATPEPAVVGTRRAEEELERAPAPREAHPSVVEVLFDHGAAALTASARSALDGLSEQVLASDLDYYLELQGHADGTGDETANLRLAELRAERVRTYLHREKGLPLDSLGVVPHGSAVPVADDATPDGRARNRRVAVVLIPPP